MTEKERLKQEIAQIIDGHNRLRARRRKTRIIAAGTALVLLLLTGIITVIPDLGESAKARPFEHIAGNYMLCDVDVLDMFGFPEDHNAVNGCTIDENGSIRFPYYDGEPQGKGKFGMIKGVLKRYEFGTHDYEIEVADDRVRNLYLDFSDDKIRIHEESSYNGKGHETWLRKIDYYFN